MSALFFVHIRMFSNVHITEVAISNTFLASGNIANMRMMLAFDARKVNVISWYGFVLFDHVTF